MIKAMYNINTSRKATNRTAKNISKFRAITGMWYTIMFSKKFKLMPYTRRTTIKFQNISRCADN